MASTIYNRYMTNAELEEHLAESGHDESWLGDLARAGLKIINKTCWTCKHRYNRNQCGHMNGMTGSVKRTDYCSRWQEKTSLRCCNPGWVMVGREDGVGRRSIWARYTDAGDIEVCGGREGDDTYALFEKGTAGYDIFSAQLWALEMSDPGNETRLSRQVAEFISKCGHHLSYKPYPHIPDDATVRLKAKLVLEEAIELMDSVYDLKNKYPSMLEALTTVADLANRLPPSVNMVEMADALADIDYVVEGMRLTFGINGQPIADEVHRANMEKFGPGSWVREDGKQMKPPDWKPPDIAKQLEDQGWSK